MKALLILSFIGLAAQGPTVQGNANDVDHYILARYLSPSGVDLPRVLGPFPSKRAMPDRWSGYVSG